MTDGLPHSPPPFPALQVFHCRDWRLIRHLRLRALVTDPDAFLPEDDEYSRPDEDWMTATEELTWVAATVADRGVGLARSRKAADGVHVESVWVAPGQRRAGVATGLLRELFRIEREHGVPELFVWVLEGNRPARALYRRLGFRESDRKPLADGRTEVRFARRLDRA